MLVKTAPPFLLFSTIFNGLPECHFHCTETYQLISAVNMCSLIQGWTGTGKRWFSLDFMVAHGPNPEHSQAKRYINEPELFFQFVALQTQMKSTAHSVCINSEYQLLSYLGLSSTVHLNRDFRRQPSKNWSAKRGGSPGKRLP